MESWAAIGVMTICAGSVVFMLLLINLARIASEPRRSVAYEEIEPEAEEAPLFYDSQIVYDRLEEVESVPEGEPQPFLLPYGSEDVLEYRENPANGLIELFPIAAQPIPAAAPPEPATPALFLASSLPEGALLRSDQQAPEPAPERRWRDDPPLLELTSRLPPDYAGTDSDASRREFQQWMLDHRLEG